MLRGMNFLFYLKTTYLFMISVNDCICALLCVICVLSISDYHLWLNLQ
jgi:hypothetical protein